MPLGNRGRSLLIGVQARDAADTATHGGRGPAELVEAVDRARATAGLDADQVGLLVTDAADDLVAAGRDRGFVPVPVVEAATGGTFAFRHGDDFAQHVERTGAELASARLRWAPDDDADRKKAQALGLTKLAAWLHETDRRLLVEVVVPTADAGAALDAVREIRDLGTEPDLWAVGHEVADADALDELARDAGRDEVAVLALVLDGTRDTPPPGRGVVLDHAAWAGGPEVDPDTDVWTDRAAARIVRAIGLDPPTAAPPA